MFKKFIFSSQFSPTWTSVRVWSTVAEHRILTHVFLEEITNDLLTVASQITRLESMQLFLWRTQKIALMQTMCIRCKVLIDDIWRSTASISRHKLCCQYIFSEYARTNLELELELEHLKDLVWHKVIFTSGEKWTPNSWWMQASYTMKLPQQLSYHARDVTNEQVYI